MHNTSAEKRVRFRLENRRLGLEFKFRAEGLLRFEVSALGFQVEPLMFLMYPNILLTLLACTYYLD